MDNPIIQRPLIPILLSYLSGIFIGSYCTIAPFKLFVAILLLLIFLISTIIFKQNRASLIITILLIHVLGMLAIRNILTEQLSPTNIVNYVTGEKVVLEGVIYNNPEIRLDKTRLYLMVETIAQRNKVSQVTGKLLLTIKQKATSFSSGDRVRFFAKIRFPRNFNNPGGFDYQRYLALKGIRVIASLPDESSIELVEKSSPPILLAHLQNYRTRISNFLTSHLPAPELAIAQALMLGEKGGIEREMKEQFAATGVAHILAISGLHIGIIALASFWLVKTMLKCSTWIMLATDISKVAALITLLPVTAYCFIAGNQIATVRATIMVTTYLISIIIDRRDDLWNTLSLSALLILIFSPAALFDISFQLSFVSVMSILYIAPPCSSFLFQHTHDPLTPSPVWWKDAARRILLFLTITTAAMIGTAPIVCLYFNRLSPLGLVTNLLIIPLVGFLIVPLGLLTALFLFIFQPLAIWGTFLMQILITLSLAIVKFFSTLPYANFRTTTPTLLEIVIFYTGIVCLVQLGKSKKARLGFTLVSLALIADQSFWYYQTRLSPLLRITAIDVGQGEAILLQLPYGKTMLIDGGGFSKSSFDIGEKVVAPVLWKKKIRDIDVVVLSHPHPDHLNGLLSLINNFTVNEVWTNGEATSSETFEAFEASIAEKGIRKLVISCEQPDRTMGDVTIEILHPPPAAVFRRVKSSHVLINNQSLVLRLIFKDVSILFTGDICEAAERELMERTLSLESTILKIPHHGSKTSSSLPFLNAVRPSIAILSVGYNNIFRLPNPTIIKRYEEQGCKLLRTDRDGAISIETDGSTVRLKTFLE